MNPLLRTLPRAAATSLQDPPITLRRTIPNRLPPSSPMRSPLQAASFANGVTEGAQLVRGGESAMRETRPGFLPPLGGAEVSHP